MPLNLDYYYGNEAEQYSFYRIPKVLFTDSRFRTVSVEAKVLYGLLLDRMALSVKNGWLDGEGRVYIIFTINDMMAAMGCAEQKANKLLSELDSVKGVGLIQRKRRGLGKPNIIYVKNFLEKTLPESQIQDCENHKSGNVKATALEMRKPQTNKTDSHKTDFSDINPSFYPAEPADKHSDAGRREDVMDRINTYRRQIRENIEYDMLVRDNPYDRQRLDGFVELMAEVCGGSRKTIRINQENLPAEMVKSRFLQLDSDHIRYVMECLDRNATLVGNIRAYILSALYNAPATISQYYASLVSHDMAKGFGGRGFPFSAGNFTDVDGP